uniref:Ig-like domain-containing protein n=1 Tax=Ciona savignyi TaxID=51511 RepID=H2YXR8_CIOSA
MGTINADHSLSLTGLSSKSAGTYCCKRGPTNHTVSCHTLVMIQPHTTSPMVYVAVVLSVVVVLIGLAWFCMRRVRRKRRENYGLLNDRAVFRPSVDSVGHDDTTEAYM